MSLRCVILFFALLVGGSAHAGDGRLVWKTLESDHFVITYYEPNGDVAERVAVVAERAHRTLVPVLGHAPSRKTHILLLDTTDAANGFASAFGRPEITLFVTAPDPLSVLNDFDDWLHLLVVHEYTHVLHLDTTGGLPALYNRIFGKQWLPNGIQPRWFVEGLATYEESKRTAAGRARSALFDMYLRTRFLAGKEFRLDEVIHGPRAFPYGNTAYLYGMSFLGYVGDRYGDDVMRTISHAYGSHPIPFDLGRAFRLATGKNVEELWREWQGWMRRRFEVQVAAARRRGLREGRKLTDSGDTNADPRYTRDGREIVWKQSDGWTHVAYRRMPSGGGPAREVMRLDASGAFSFLPDGSGLVVEQFWTHRAMYGFSDLVHHDLATGRTRRLTKAARASSPDVSPDGTQVAAVVNGSGKTRLALFELREGARPEIVWEGPGRFDQVSSPAWSPDGTRLAFSAWSNGGWRDLWVLDVKSRRARRLTEDRAQDLQPRWSPDGRWLLFSSDRTGIYNIYALSLETGALKQVTNVIGGAFSPDVSPDGKRLVYVGFDDDGYELYELELDEAHWLDAEAYVDDRPDPVRVGSAAREGVRVGAPRPYRPLETLRPDTWNARFGFDSFGRALSISTGGRDVAGLHSYFLGVTVGQTRGDVSFGAAYSYNRFWPSLNLGAARSIGRPGGLVVDGYSMRYTEEAWAASGSIGLPIVRHPDYSSDLAVGYQVDWLRNVDGLPPIDPNAAVTRPPETGVVAGASLRWSFSNVHHYAFRLGPVEGRALGAGLRWNHPALGSDFRSLEISWRWSEYVPMPWPGGQILSLEYRGAREVTDRRRDGPYVLGGTPRQDLLRAVLDQTRAGTSGILRGYDPGLVRGRAFHLLNAEYRVPLVEVEQGLGSAPLYFRRLHAAALLDAGTAYDDEFRLEEVRYAVGAALRLDLVLGFFAGGALELGYARGLSRDGRGEWWLLLTHAL